ncbi:hypothetical protein GIB67_004923 [Kingdonia uniflora]|uniref:U3 small nucleolar RNA-associated protein 6 homolog C-terminal domain-containing protein n=1 Tax=Kingdonia uniflora TaxID=39325 RepID=A0A7J7P778_9MAGN|nr:hypothetical protein GIB67_004923 [Kingdonia uniflora]
MTVSEVESLWRCMLLTAIKCFSNQKKYFDKLLRTFLSRLAGDKEGGLSLSSVFLKFGSSEGGIQRARETYKRFLGAPHPGLAIYRNCIELESNLAFVGDSEGLVNARKLYESAVSSYDQDVGLWQNYYSFEIKVGTSEKANAVYWRVKKTLKDTTGLIAPQDL